MTHEPECPMLRRYLAGECICHELRAAYQRGDTAGYQRGMKRAAEIAQDRHDDMLYCSKPDDCHTIARGAELAAADILWEADKAAAARGGSHE